MLYIVPYLASSIVPWRGRWFWLCLNGLHEAGPIPWRGPSLAGQYGGSEVELGCPPGLGYLFLIVEVCSKEI